MRKQVPQEQQQCTEALPIAIYTHLPSQITVTFQDLPLAEEGRVGKTKTVLYCRHRLASSFD